MQKISVFLNKFYKKWPVIAFDIFAIPIAWYFSYWLRYNMQPFPSRLLNFQTLLAVLILGCVQVSGYYYFRVYRGLWRFSSLNDVGRIIKAVISATIITVPVLYLCSLLHNIPRSIFPLYCIILMTLLCSGRLVKRAYFDKQTKPSPTGESKKVLIIGAGRAGESLVRDLKRHASYLPMGFIDDNPNKRGQEVHGVEVLGAIHELANFVLYYKIDLVFIAIPSARSAEMRRIVNYCETAQVPFRTLPSISALVAGRVEVNSLRNVNIEDLLGRDQVQLEWEKIAATIYDKRILITGGGGSIGSELCRQVLMQNPSQLMIIDNSEFNLYKIGSELDEKFPHCTVQLKLVSVTDSIAIDFLFHQFKPQIVFHAAAYKHVPMLEDQVRVAVQNNIVGTQVVAEAAVSSGVEKFILISTDKAVNPTNVMGTSKRVAEIYCQNLDERVDTQFITVRFGNVLGSAGSVVPLFQRQLQKGGPLTVTHPDIQRYFMTIPEACQLILQAMVNGHGGEIFVLDMGEPIKIAYLAEQMIRLAGKEPGKDILIEYTGLRPGEKLYEELFYESEQLRPTAHEKLFQAKFRRLDWQELTQTLRLLHTACTLHHVDEIHVLLKSLVPEFKNQFEIMEG